MFGSRRRREERERLERLEEERKRQVELKQQVEVEKAKKARQKATEARIMNGEECPKCGSRRPLTLWQPKELQTYETTETKTRTTRRYNRDGEYIGYNEEEYEAPVTRSYYLLFWKCNDCDATHLATTSPE
jgi:Zn ribbon nucleic-acid-binding protein